MTPKSNILKSSYDQKCKGSSTLGFKLCFLFLIVYIPTASGRAETLSEDLDPIDLLESSSLPGTQNVNKSNISERSNTSFGIMEPAMQNRGWVEKLFGWMTGTGPGSGMAVMMVVFGILTILALLSGYVLPKIRNMEDFLPDHDQLAKVE